MAYRHLEEKKKKNFVNCDQKMYFKSFVVNLYIQLILLFQNEKASNLPFRLMHWDWQ